MPTLDAVQVQLTADIGQFQSGFNQATTSVQNFQNATQTASRGTQTFYEGVSQAGEYAVGSERGIRRMELALGSVAAQAVGTNHAIGQLSEGLLLFGGGSALTLGVLGGIAAIYGAYQILTKESRDAEQATKDLEKALEGLGEHGKIVALQVEAGAIEAQIEHIKDVRRKLGLGDMGALTGESEGIATWFGFSEGDIIDLEAKLQGVNDRINQMKTHFAGQEAKKAGEEAWHEWETFGAVLAEVNDRMDQFDATVLNTISTMSTEDLNAILMPKMSDSDFFKGEGQDLETSQWFTKMKRQMDEASRETQRQARAWGQSISEALVEGISGKLNSLGDLLKKVIESFVEKYVVGPILKALLIASPSGFGQYVGEMLTAGIAQGVTGNRGVQGVGDMRLHLSLNMGGMTAASNPLAAARDQEWQRFMRESILVAGSDGFRA